MRRYFASILSIGLILQSCGTEKEAFKHYGPTAVDSAKAISMDEMVKQFNQNPQQDTFTFSAPIVNVCQSAGCWVNVKKSDGDLLRIRFKDHFGIPPKTTFPTPSGRTGIEPRPLIVPSILADCRWWRRRRGCHGGPCGGR